jgi:hypothetical protein
MTFKINKSLNYSHTNESLRAIVEGLDINPDDIILAVGASGDQAFALLDGSKSVRVAELRSCQIDYIRKREKLLRKGDYQEFLRIDELGYDDGANRGVRDFELAQFNIDRRNEFFSQSGRLDRIRGNLDGLYIEECTDVFVAAQEGSQTKVYLSNPDIYSQEDIEAFRGLISRLPVSGLIYIGKPLSDVPDGLRLDSRLSEKAREHEKTKWNLWQPTVYRVM